MSFPETIMRQVKQALNQTDTRKEFALRIEKIIRERCGASHPAQQDIIADITFQCRIAKDNDFADRQLIKLVANYVEKSLDNDPSSRQDETKNFTYMKSIRN